MMSRQLQHYTLGALALSLSACAGGDGRYPSLALRPFETAGVAEAPSPPPPPPASSSIRPVVDTARLTALRDKALAAHAGFAAQERVAAPLARAAAGQPAESNARAAAIIALADLRSRRGATSSALADIDLLHAEGATALTPDPALSAVQAEVTALLAREDAMLAQLWQVIGR
jgi:hypothetical protein